MTDFIPGDHFIQNAHKHCNQLHECVFQELPVEELCETLGLTNKLFAHTKSNLNLNSQGPGMLQWLEHLPLPLMLTRTIPDQCQMWAEFVVGSRIALRVILWALQFCSLYKNQNF